jgi:predicted transcriptional regulator
MRTKSDTIPEIISVAPGEMVRSALDKMKTYHIAQIPVLEKGKSIGSLDEGTLMGKGKLSGLVRIGNAEKQAGNLERVELAGDRRKAVHQTIR